MTKREMATSARRLLKLAAYLRTVKPSRFDYRDVIRVPGSAPAEILTAQSGATNELVCGATACAIGHAATMPEFRRLGLWIDGFSVVGPENSTAFQGMERVFLLSRDESLYLFQPEMPPISEGNPYGPTNSATAEQVAAHIERFVRDHRTWKDA